MTPIIFVAGSYQISESMQALNGVSGEAVLNGQYHPDDEYHRLEPNQSQGYLDSNQTEFYPSVPEQKYRPPMMRMNSGKSLMTSHCRRGI